MRKKNIILLFTAPTLVTVLFSCSNDTTGSKVNPSVKAVMSPGQKHLYAKADSFYQANVKDTLPSISHGTPKDGRLEHGKPVPFSGNNFLYFSETSYLGGRCFMNDRALSAVLDTYKDLETEVPGRIFGVMETGLKGGGEIKGHRTHRNGLSIDFMTPVLKDGKPTYALDCLGAEHYALEFDDTGRYLQDSAISIDFEMVAHHLLTLDRNARKTGMKIEKVILKKELKDELFATPSGKKLKKSGIYFARNFDEAVNISHDDHYHVDLAFLNPK